MRHRQIRRRKDNQAGGGHFLHIRMTATPSSRSEASGRYFADRLITRLALHNRPRATARVAKFLLRRMSACGNAPAASERPKRVLILLRRGFTDDILSALSDVPSLEIVALRRR